MSRHRCHGPGLGRLSAFAILRARADYSMYVGPRKHHGSTDFGLRRPACRKNERLNGGPQQRAVRGLSRLDGSVVSHRSREAPLLSSEARQIFSNRARRVDL